MDSDHRQVRNGERREWRRPAFALRGVYRTGLFLSLSYEDSGARARAAPAALQIPVSPRTRIEDAGRGIVQYFTELISSDYASKRLQILDCAVGHDVRKKMHRIGKRILLRKGLMGCTSLHPSGLFMVWGVPRVIRNCGEWVPRQTSPGFGGGFLAEFPVHDAQFPVAFG